MKAPTPNRTCGGRRKPTALSLRELNVQRLLNPPPPGLLARLRSAAYEAEEWWCRHVTQREVYRALDALSAAARAQFPYERETRDSPDSRLQRLRERVAEHHRRESESRTTVAPFEVPPEDHIRRHSPE